MNMMDPFEPTPAGFHLRVEQKLNELQNHVRPMRRGYRWAAALAACLALLCGTALALERLGVWHFLTERIWMGAAVNASAIVEPTQQSCDSRLLNAAVRDAYWDGETLSIALHVEPRGDYAFYTETDVGQDGEHFDLIWWNGEILPLEEWKAGRAELMLRLPRLMNESENITVSWDWVQNEQGETLLIQGACNDLTHGGSFHIALQCETKNQTEQSTLTFTLPPMTKGEPTE